MWDGPETPFRLPPRRTFAAFDEVYGGLVPGEVAVLACDHLDVARFLALDVAAAAVQADPERRVGLGQALWYTADVHRWPTHRYEAELRVRVPEHFPRIQVTGTPKIPADEWEKQVRSWAQNAQGPALVVLDGLDGLLGRADTQARMLKRLSLREPKVAILVLASWPHASGPTLADYNDIGEAVDFLVWLQVPFAASGRQVSLLAPSVTALCDVRKARAGVSPATMRIPVPTTRCPPPRKVS